MWVNKQSPRPMLWRYPVNCDVPFPLHPYTSIKRMNIPVPLLPDTTRQIPELTMHTCFTFFLGKFTFKLLYRRFFKTYCTVRKRINPFKIMPHVTKNREHFTIFAIINFVKEPRFFKGGERKKIYTVIIDKTTNSSYPQTAWGWFIEPRKVISEYPACCRSFPTSTFIPFWIFTRCKETDLNGTCCCLSCTIASKKR